MLACACAHQPGMRTATSNAAFGYNFEGALQEYVLMDERIITAPNGESMLIPASENMSGSAIALAEPWACVEDAYVSKERTALKAGGRMLIVADVEISGSTATLANNKTVYESKDRSCTIEAQDFYDDDKKMIFTCYEPEGHAEVMGIDLASGEVTNFSKSPNTYNEPEGIFPDGLYTCVEGDRQCLTLGPPCGSGNIDVWKLRLDGTGKDFTRLTHFNDYEGAKASNPVVSTDGRFMAFQSARASDPAGVGYGILLYWFKK